MNYAKSYRSAQLGFTLIELMISLVLGLLISAAVIQVYIINTRTLTIQQGASEVQDSAIFALQPLEEHIRIANLGNPITSITNTTNHGGIVLSAANLGSSNDTDAQYFTNSASDSSLSNTDVGSDQLTIQYKNITPNSLYDCEGGEIPDDSSWVVERYFLRLATGASATPEIKDLVLACDAGRVDDTGAVVKSTNSEGAETSSTFSGNGSVIAPAVDQFQVLLGTQTSIDTLTYLSASEYLSLAAADKPAITTVKIGFIVRSNTPLITDTDTSQFNLFGQSQELKASTDTRKKYYRRSYESTILLRNARVMSVTATAESVVPQ